jgi:hypothetical protein
MRVAMIVTAAMNGFGAALLSPIGAGLRVFFGLPDDGSTLYMSVVACFILIFGLAYLWAGVQGQADTLFVAVAAIGKLTFFGLLVGFAVAGQLPGRVVLGGLGDLFFGVLFLVWLIITWRQGQH